MITLNASLEHNGNVVSLHMSSDIICFKRLSGELSGAHVRDRAVISALNAYAQLSTAWMQRGLYRACKLAGGLWAGRSAKIVLGADASVVFPASDPYWNRMLLSSYDHEPELASFLKRLTSVDYAFVDCGANIGYWSVFANAKDCGGGKPVIAIEASHSTFGHLLTNTKHAGSIETIHKAIFSTSGETVWIDDAAHEARGIVDGNRQGEVVETVSIDDLLQDAGWLGRRLVIKLDVEGVEREALQGMAKTLSYDPLIIYEDHGSDPSNALTLHILEHLGLLVHALLPSGSIPIHTSDDLRALKTDRTKGYNLVAVRPGSQWSWLF
jgi:FkbM family methyltransferase